VEEEAEEGEEYCELARDVTDDSADDRDAEVKDACERVKIEP
jgi:hypothetical protein